MALCAAFALAVPVAAGQTPAGPEEGSAVATTITPVPAPKDKQESTAVRRRVQKRLAELPAADLAEDAPPAARALSQAQQAVRATLEEYLQQLEALDEAQAQAAGLGSEEAIAARTATVETYRARIAQIKASMRTLARFPSASYVAAQRDEIAAEYKHINELTDTSNKQQTNRQQVLAGFARPEQEAADRIAQARAKFDGFLKAPATSTEDAGKLLGTNGLDGLDSGTLERIRALTAERLAWEVSIANLLAEQLVARKIILHLEVAAAESVLPVLQTYARTLGDYRTRLEESASQSEAQHIDAGIAGAGTPHEKAYWEYRAQIVDARGEFTSRMDGIRSRFRESEKEKLARATNAIAQSYRSLMERLERTGGADKTDAYLKLDGYIREYTRAHENLVAMLDQSHREHDQLLRARDRAAEALGQAREKFREAVRAIPAGEERREFDRRSAELASDHQPQLEATIGEVIAAEEELITRLTEADENLRAFLDELAVHRQGLFWSYTLARGPHLPAALGAAYRDALSPGFVGELREAYRRCRSQLAGIEPRQWADTLGMILVACLVGFVARRRLVAGAAAHRAVVEAALQEQGKAEVNVTDRFRIQLARIAAYGLPLAMPLAVLLVVASFTPQLTGDVRLLLVRILTFALAAFVARALIFHLFKPGKTRFRLIPCSNVVRQYFRRWTARLWWLTIVLVPMVIVLNSLAVGQRPAGALWRLYAAMALLLVFLFARKRQTVIRIVGRGIAQRRPALIKLIVAVYPFALLAAGGLFVLEVIGFGALIDYLVRNTIHTAAALVVALLLAGLIGDVTRRHARGPKAPTAPAPRDEQVAETTIDDLFDSLEARELGLAVSALATLGRWLVWIGALVWMCVSWGMTRITARRILLYELNPNSASPVTLLGVLAGIFSIVVALKLSRGLRQMLETKIYPAYGAINRGAQATINTLLHYTLLVLGVYIGLRFVHINLGALAVLLGGLGLGLGLGLQPLVVNFVSGLIIFAERHVKVGDIVEVDGSVGEVTRISMRSTQIKTFDNIDKIIPNGQFVTSAVTNWTLHDTRIRGKVNVGVAYGSNVELVRDILLDIARSNERVLADPAPTIWFLDFADSSLNFTLASWFATPGDRWNGMVAMRYEIERRFKEAGIEIPFPQRTLSIPPEIELPVRILPQKDQPAPEPEHKTTPSP